MLNKNRLVTLPEAIHFLTDVEVGTQNLSALGWLHHSPGISLGPQGWGVGWVRRGELRANTWPWIQRSFHIPSSHQSLECSGDLHPCHTLKCPCECLLH